MILKIRRWIRTAVIFSLWWIIAILPESASLRLAPFLGMVLRMGTRDQITETMKRVLGHERWTDEEWMALWKSNVRHVGLMLAELVHLHTMPIPEVRKRIIIQSKSHLDNALDSGKGVMLFVNHLGNMACVVGGLAIHGYDVALAGNRQNIPYLERKLKQIHDRVGAHRVYLGKQIPFLASRIFANNGIFATFIDFPVSEKHVANFRLGQETMKVSLGPAIIALRNHVDVICASCLRLPGNNHQIVIHPPLNIRRTGDLHEDATRLMEQAFAIFETDLLEHPELWWTWDKTHLCLQGKPRAEFPSPVGAEIS